MSEHGERLYYSLPPVLQNVLVTLYGCKLRRQRFGRESAPFLQQLAENESLDTAGIAALQEALFRGLVRHAIGQVPFYRDYCRRERLAAEDFRSLDDLVKLPVVTKDMIRQDPLAFCAENYLKSKDTFWLSTSGTSGKPLRIFCDRRARQRHYAVWSRFRQWCGLRPRHTRATFFGRIIMAPDCNRPPFWRYDACGRNYLFSSYHLSAANLPAYYDKLSRLQPEELIGYPSSLFLLAKYCVDRKLSGIRPQAVITTAETLLPQQRSLMQEAFGGRVFDQYGCTEMALFVSQCEHGSYHIHPEHGYLEVLDGAGGQPVDAGQAGNAVCTGFLNMAMPLIRYELGDRVVMARERQCSCGRRFPVVEEIVGRLDDVLVAPDGRPLGRLDPVFKGMKGIYETQIVQNERDSLQINMVVDATFTDRSMQELIYEFRKRVGADMQLHINLMDSIPKDSNGKFRSVISTITS